MSENYHIVTDKELHDDERISAYLRDRMPEEEEGAFMEELHSDNELRSRAISTAHLAKAMKKIGEENDEKVKEALLSINLASARHIASKTTWAIMPEACDYAITPKDEEESSTSSTSTTSSSTTSETSSSTSETSDKRRRILKVISIAACFLVLFGVGFKYYEYRHVMKLGEEYCSVFVSEQAPSRGMANADVSKDLQALYANVQEGKDLDKTTRRLSVLWELSIMKTYDDYTNEAPYIGWNLAIAYLKDNNKDEAKTVLAKLLQTTESGGAVNDEAKELLEKLK